LILSFKLIMINTCSFIDFQMNSPHTTEIKVGSWISATGEKSGDIIKQFQKLRNIS
jgi:hypothetical protein